MCKHSPKLSDVPRENFLALPNSGDGFCRELLSKSASDKKPVQFWDPSSAGTMTLNLTLVFWPLTNFLLSASDHRAHALDESAARDSNNPFCYV